MKFGAAPLTEAKGAILAHSLRLPGLSMKKGALLSAERIAQLSAAGMCEVVVARLDSDDMFEDAAAAAIATAISAAPGEDGFSVSAPFTGRVNLFAARDGVLRVDAAVIAALNGVDESITMATLADYARVAARQMIATVKIIPYAAPAEAVARARAVLTAAAPALRVHGVLLRTAGLILTRTPGMRAALLDKGAEAVRARLTGLGIRAAGEARVEHRTEALAGALREAPGEMILILGGSATSDREDVGPAALRAAGGTMARFGMPVDPGNLLFLGDLNERLVLGLPGCTRSPKLNGADWVLERIACALPVGAADIAAMGVGGLLKEIPARPEPRSGGAPASARPFVSAILLAAGAGMRMRGGDKMLEQVDGEPLIRRMTRMLLASRADEMVVVLGAAASARRAALDGLAVRIVDNPLYAGGMGTSIAAGMRSISAKADAVLLALGDMPEVRAADVDRLIAAFDPGEGRAICRAATASGAPGHPVLFGRRFFESLARLEGDEGARRILDENAEFIVLTPMPGEGARIDLDTPEDWAVWRASR